MQGVLIKMTCQCMDCGRFIRHPARYCDDCDMNRFKEDLENKNA